MLSTAARQPRRFDIFLVPRFSLLTFASATEPLRIANWLAGRDLYTSRLISVDGAPVASANGLMVPAHMSVAQAQESTTLIVCASVDAHLYAEREVLAWLRRLARAGVQIGGVGAGAYLLARAGLLAGRPCTLHWQEHETFREHFPDHDISDAIYERSGNVFTCAGGAAATDLMLRLIAEDHGHDFAGAIADQFISGGVRGGHTQQRMPIRARMGIKDRRVLKAIEIMEANIEAPLPIPRICKAAGISIRHLQRGFATLLNCTPQQYYLGIRLRFARQRLLHSDDRVLEIAVSAGFLSASHFCRKYREFFGHPPADERARARNAGRPPSLANPAGDSMAQRPAAALMAR